MIDSGKQFFLISLFILGFTSPICRADITRVYHPYVEPLEHEIEFRLTQSQDAINQHYQLYTLGYGQSVSDKLFIEGYVNSSESSNSGTEVEAFEVEGLYQLTEEGSHYFDYGVLLEAQRESKNNISDIGSTLLLEKGWQHSSLTANIGVTYEYGAGITNDFNIATRLQWLYRYKPYFEPALEIHLDEYDKCAGFTLIGSMSTSKNRKLKWEGGLLFALDKQTADTTLRALLEYEF